MKSKGFTLVELLVSVSLVAIIMIFLFQVILILKDLFVSSGIKTELLNKQSLLSEKINSQLVNHTVLAINKCGVNCLTFIYDNGESDQLEIDKVNKTFQFGDYKTELVEGSNFQDINIGSSLLSLDATYNNAVLQIKVPIVNKLFPDKDYGINVVYQYNTSVSNFNNVIFGDEATTSGHIALVGDTTITIGCEAYDDALYGYQYYAPDGSVVSTTTLVTMENPFLNLALPYTNGNYYLKYILHDSDGNVIQTLERVVTVACGS